MAVLPIQCPLISYGNSGPQAWHGGPRLWGYNSMDVMGLLPCYTQFANDDCRSPHCPKIYRLETDGLRCVLPLHYRGCTPLIPC
jgi:hypothetical protein